MILFMKLLYQKASLWKIFLVQLLIISAVVFGVLHYFAPFETLDLIDEIQISVYSGIIHGFISSVFLYFGREAQKFYADCDALENKVISAKHREDLGDLFTGEFSELRQRAFHREMHHILFIIHVKMQSMLGHLPKKNLDS
jgi:hypothetical protein